MDENRESGRVSLGLSVVVRVTLKDGVYHEVDDLNDILTPRILDMDLSRMPKPRLQHLKRYLFSDPELMASARRKVRLTL
jgi:hypothetical protein